jgi:KUP system potassium uptake protein
VFLTREKEGTPPVMQWQVKRNGSLHGHVLSLTIAIDNVPRINADERLTVTQLAPGFWHALAVYGFMERPNIPALLRYPQLDNCELDTEDVTYYLGHENIIPREGSGGLPAWQRVIFSWMARNGMHVTDYYYLPSDRVVEIGRRIPV